MAKVELTPANSFSIFQSFFQCDLCQTARSFTGTAGFTEAKFLLVRPEQRQLLIILILAAPGVFELFQLGWRTQISDCVNQAVFVDGNNNAT